jgi:hypothetical protein
MLLVSSESVLAESLPDDDKVLNIEDDESFNNEEASSCANSDDNSFLSVLLVVVPEFELSICDK